jgi:hypothetical protein
MNGRPGLFHKRQFAAEIIVTCVRWYLRFALSFRDVEELMAERGLSVDHNHLAVGPDSLRKRIASDPASSSPFRDAENDTCNRGRKQWGGCRPLRTCFFDRLFVPSRR